jgi:hypothetical protein
MEPGVLQSEDGANQELPTSTASFRSKGEAEFCRSCSSLRQKAKSGKVACKTCIFGEMACRCREPGQKHWADFSVDMRVF